MDALIKSLVQAGFAPERIIPRAPMSEYTTFRIGGEAEVLVDIASQEEIAVALRAAKASDAPVTVIGRGSNLLVRDGGIRGLVLHLGDAFSDIRREGELLKAQAGASMNACACFAQREGMDGLSELSGIPGSIGGAAIMNAGAFGKELGPLVTRVDAVTLTDAKSVSFEPEALHYAYRTSALLGANIAVTQVTLRLTDGDSEAITKRMAELARQRREKQPLEYASAGSAFKRPDGQYAAKLIDECGLRGLRVGDAQVSEKHAGFIINLGEATARDVLILMEEIVQRVKKQTGVTLEPELRVIGEDAQTL